MDSENKKEEIIEEDPQYKQKISRFGISALIVLIVGLLLNVFFDKGSSKRAPEKQEENPITVIPQGTTSEREFEKGIQAAIDKKARENRQHDPYPNETESQVRDRLRNQKRSGLASYYGGNKTMSIEDQFEEAELKRALEARKVKFNIRKNRSDSMNIKSSGKEALEKKFFKSFEKKMAQFKPINKKLQNSQDPNPSSLQDFLGLTEQKSTLNVGQPVSESEPKPGQLLIPIGTVINAVLDQDIMSDYVGGVRMRITHDVYDITDSNIMIPKGCLVTGQSLRIMNVNEPIQARMGITVKWLRLPNGKRISFEKTSSLDQAGIPAIKDKVNYHFFAQFMGVAAYALVGSETSYEGSGFGNDSSFKGEVGSGMREIMAAHAAKYLMLVPTITLRAGTPVKIFLEDDIYSYPWENLNERFLKASR